MNLSPRGHLQADALATFLDKLKPQAIYASPMKRVQLTLAPFLKNHTPSPVILNDLREVDFGDWTGLVWEEVREKFGISAYEWLDHLSRDTIPNAEKISGYRARVESCVQQIIRGAAGQNVLVACHGGVIRMMLAILLELPLAKMAAFEIDYASVTHIELRDSRVILQKLNFTTWTGEAL
jgi:broad specificity phosphatase PhoE